MDRLLAVVACMYRNGNVPASEAVKLDGLRLRFSSGIAKRDDGRLTQTMRYVYKLILQSLWGRDGLTNSISFSISLDEYHF